MTGQLVVLRRWAVRIRTADRDAYVRYIEDTGIADYLETPGNLGGQMLMRDLGDATTEVTTLSWWLSLDAVRAFAGLRLDFAQPVSHANSASDPLAPSRPRPD